MKYLLSVLLLLSAAFTTAQSVASNLDISGRVSVQFQNSSQVRITIDRVTNRDSGGYSGTVYARLVVSTSQNYSRFWEVARYNFSGLPNQFSQGSGRIPAGGSFSNISFTTSIIGRPPAGTYYAHVVLTEYDTSLPNNGANTHIDAVTMSERLTVSSNGSFSWGGGTTPNPGTDDHSNSRSGASTISMNSSRSGRIERGGDVDYFTFTVPSGGTVTVSSSGSTDTYGSLYNSSGSLIENDDDDGTGTNFSIRRNLSAGRYYVRVRHYNSSSGTGSYTVRVSCSNCNSPPPPPSDDHGNTRSSATNMSLNTSRSGRIESGGDVDYFTFSVGSGGTVTVSTSGSTDTYGSLYNSSGSLVESDDDDGSGTNFQIRRYLSAGRYYVRVRHYNSSSGTGSYTFRASCSDCSSPPPPPPTDDYHSNSRSGATPLGANSSDTGQLHRGDVDYFRIQLNQSGRLRVQTQGSTDTYGQLQNSGGSTIISNDDGGSGTNFLLDRNLSPGTYYVRVRHYSSTGTGSYSIHTSFSGSSAPDDHGNSSGRATEVNRESTTRGSLEQGRDRDWFRIEIYDHGRYQFWTDGDTDTVGYLYGRNSNGGIYRIVGNNNGGQGLNFRIRRNLSPGTYFIRLQGRNSRTVGDYFFNSARL